MLPSFGGVDAIFVSIIDIGYQYRPTFVNVRCTYKGKSLLGDADGANKHINSLFFIVTWSSSDPSIKYK